MGWITSILTKAIDQRAKLESSHWRQHNIDRQFAINRIYNDVCSLYLYVERFKKRKSNALAMVLDFLTSYDQFNQEQIKHIRTECLKLSDK